MRKEHRFLRTAEDDTELTYEKRLAKKYYEKLFKEYAIADLRLYREGKVGLRWRTEQEVIDGKGQFVCGARGCDTAAHLASFEVHLQAMFPYVIDNSGSLCVRRGRRKEGCVGESAAVSALR